MEARPSPLISSQPVQVEKIDFALIRSYIRPHVRVHSLGGLTMRDKLRVAMIALSGLVLTGAAALPAFAHHSFTAEFDVDKPVTIKGNITKVDWINPHIYFYVDVKDENGKVENWAIEGDPTRIMHEGGVTKAMLDGQQNVTVLAYRAKDGSKALAFIRKITFSDGHSFELWRGDPSQFK